MNRIPIRVRFWGRNQLPYAAAHGRRPPSERLLEVRLHDDEQQRGHGRAYGEKAPRSEQA